jgi:pSer/pThr/pTyr-binding forkhead associated (FHA) protein
VLLHAAHTKALNPAENTGEMTLDRMVLREPDPEPQADGAADKSVRTISSPGISLGRLYTVFDLIATNPSATMITVGCSSECDVQVNDQSISKLHAVVEGSDESYFIRDNNSSSGTQVNDDLLEPDQPRELAAGDRVTLGFVDLTFLPATDFYQFVRRLFID